MELRALGRRLGADSPDQSLLERTKSAASAALSAQMCATLERQRRKAVSALLVALLITIPIPALFLWADWTAVSSLLGVALPEAASRVASGIYLWVKVCALGLIYGIATPALLYAAVR